MKRTPLSQRSLPNYTRSQELANMYTHIFGIVLGIVVLILIIQQAAPKGAVAMASGCLYAVSIICLFSVSSVYHGLRPSYAKKLMQVIDHCTIYFLIAGTYSPILLVSLRPVYPRVAWIIFAAEWALVVFAAVFTAIDHKRYGKLSMACYIGMGWLILLAVRPTLEAMGLTAFLYLLAGGIAYTLGAVIYGFGKKKPALHTVFHVFVDLGCILHAVCILEFVI